MSDLNLYLVTYNCGRAFIKPEAFASHFFDAVPDSATSDQPPELIVLHLQEIAPIAEAFNGYALPQYYEKFKAAVHLAVKQRFPNTNLDEGEFVDFTTGNAGLTAIMLFVRADVQHRIESVMTADVGVGVQKVGNKGAVGARVAWSLNSNPTSDEDIMNLTFVSAHLAPMEEKLERRNQDFADIAAGLVFEPKEGNTTSPNNEREDEREPLLSTDAASHLDGPPAPIGLYSADTHVFFSGDLNYRTSSTPPKPDGESEPNFPSPTASSPTAPNHWTTLLPHDQLTAELHAQKTLHGFTESPITFAPTYKYSSSACQGRDVILDSEMSSYNWSTHRWPSWCDRILYAQPPSSSPSSNTRIDVKQYTSLPLLATSDHRPVALYASVPLRSVQNEEFARCRPVDINPRWRADRQSARWKEMVVGTVWGGVSSVDGMINLGLGIAAVTCIAIFIGVYAKEW